MFNLLTSEKPEFLSYSIYRIQIYIIGHSLELWDAPHIII